LTTGASNSDVSPQVDADRADLGELYIADRRKHRGRSRLFILSLVMVFFAVLWFVPFIPALFFSSITVTRLDAKGKPIEVEVGPATKQWIAINRVSRHVVNAVVAAEDGKFYDHYGFDFEAIGKAIEVNRKKGRYVRGASTISQQVVKMAFLTREKTLIRKAREATGVILMELLMSKDRILEWYINLCEFGGGIYGVKPAGSYYFKTRPELLTIEQAVNLAVVIPSPNKWSKGLRSKSLTPFGQRRYSRIVRNMHQAGYITEVQKSTALARGNFGNPIAGYGVSDDDEDDCRGEKDCEDATNENRVERPTDPRQTGHDGQSVGSVSPSEGVIPGKDAHQAGPSPAMIKDEVLPSSQEVP
jgi:monofunctional biosynthetic peptidoglycan transglycosylase